MINHRLDNEKNRPFFLEVLKSIRKSKGHFQDMMNNFKRKQVADSISETVMKVVDEVIMDMAINGYDSIVQRIVLGVVLQDVVSVKDGIIYVKKLEVDDAEKLADENDFVEVQENDFQWCDEETC